MSTNKISFHEEGSGMETDCESLCLLIESYIDGEVPPHGKEAIEKHLEECPSCKAREESTANLRNRIRSSLLVDLPPGKHPTDEIWSSIEQRIKSVKPSPWQEGIASRIFASQPLQFIKIPLALAAATLAAFFIIKALQPESAHQNAKAEKNRIMVQNVRSTDPSVSVMLAGEDPSDWKVVWISPQGEKPPFVNGPDR